MTLYAKRDTMAQGEHYTRHVSAMTAEGLHAKSAIAAELAHRDMEIERLRHDLTAMTEDRDSWERQAADREQDALDLVAAERERCAKLVESYCGAWSDGGFALASSIRWPNVN